MKKLILSVSLVLMSLNGYAQTGGLNSGSSAFDSSNNPSGVGFGGALGGANTPAGSMATPTPGSSAGTSTVPGTVLPQEQQETFPRGTTIEEQQEERGNFPGGSLSGQQPSNSTVAPTTPSAIPTDTTAPPTRPTNSTSPTGFGTGFGTGPGSY